MVKLSTSRPAGQHFTPLERGILAAVIAILAFVAIHSYMINSLNAKESVLRAREAVLREDCRVVHQAIDNYSVDLHKVPKSLDDLIQTGYLKALPRGFSLEACK